jgi:hypothetical protein
MVDALSWRDQAHADVAKVDDVTDVQLDADATLAVDAQPVAGGHRWRRSRAAIACVDRVRPRENAR